MFQIGHRVIRRMDPRKEIGTVIRIVTEDDSSEHAVYEVEFASGIRTLHSHELRTTWDGQSSCIERNQLSLTFQAAFKIYYDAVSALGNAAGMFAHTEFEFLLDRAEEARKVCKQARQRVQQHTAEHGC